MAEAPIVKRTMLEASKLGLRLLRNNRGLFFTLDKKRKVRAGLEAEGASDLIGMVTITITPNMVGKKIGVPLVVEVKDKGFKGPKTDTEKGQENFINQVVKRGGIGFFLDDEKKLKESVDRAIALFDTVFDKSGQDQ